MGLNFSQKRLFNKSLSGKGRGSGRHATLSPMKRKAGFSKHLEIYAFWTGFASTVISLLETVIIALKK